jgi:phosphoglycerate dehydrogenase-like enzyme
MLILILDNFDPLVHEKLKEYVDVTFDESRLSEADVILIRSKTKCDKTFIDRARNLRLIVRGGVGLDNIDTKYANARNILVKNTPKASGIAVAELAFCMMLAISNHIIEAHSSMKEGHWLKEKLMRRELYGKTVCLVGMGNTAKELAIRCRAFGMNVVAYRESKKASEYADVKATLKDAVKDADYISIHLPLNEETRAIINADIIKCMKDGVVIINTSRAECVNAEDLAKALERSKIAAYATDVWPTDPPPKDYPILNEANTLLTPHLGASSQENLIRVGEEIIKIVEEFVDHEHKA